MHAQSLLRSLPLLALLATPLQAQLGLAPPELAQRPLGRIQQMNPPGTSYVDHELHPTAPEMVFQVGNSVWTGAIDLGTGLFASGVGTDRFVDLASPLTVSRNGPEYGLDASGVAIFYNKSLFGGPERIWRATPVGDGYAVEPLSPPGLDRINQLPSQWAAAPTTWLVYAREDLLQPPGVIAWCDEANPAEETDVARVVLGFAGFRWLRDSSLFTVTESEGPDAGQVLLVDAVSGEERVVTDDAGIKFDPYPWRAPEYGGTILIASIVEESKLAIHADLGAEFFTRVATLDLPPGTRMQFLQSPEPFLSGGRSYISLTIADDPGSIYEDVTESEIWVYGIGDGPDRFARRFDDGQPGRVRHEAETLQGPDEVYLYYNRKQSGGPFGLEGFDLFRVRTGLRP